METYLRPVLRRRDYPCSAGLSLLLINSCFSAAAENTGYGI